MKGVDCMTHCYTLPSWVLHMGYVQDSAGCGNCNNSRFSCVGEIQNAVIHAGLSIVDKLLYVRVFGFLLIPAMF